MAPQAEWHSRGRLPHWEAGETPQSITFRLADSLPADVVKALKVWRSQAEPEVQRRERRKRFDALLDTGFGERILGDRRAAAIVQTAFLHFDSVRYRLHAWCVMPNHVHVMVTPLERRSLSSLVHAWKSFSAKAINAALGHEGRVWAEEYFDRAIRDERHFDDAVAYIEQNPVKAGLCVSAEDWSFSSAASRAGRQRSE